MNTLKLSDAAHSDMAMYSSKTDGKTQFRFFNPALSAALKTRAQRKHQLIEAIDRGQFVLHYQPRVDTRSGELLSMEALLRWCHPQLGMIAPGEFIPLADSSGLILPIGALVIDKACAQIAAWQRQAPLVPVSINVSSKQFLTAPSSSNWRKRWRGTASPRRCWKWKLPNRR